MRKVDVPADTALGRGCFIRRGDTGPGIDTKINVRDLPKRGGDLFIGERAVREMAQLFDMVDGESLAEALAQLKTAQDEAAAWRQKAQEQGQALQLIGDTIRAGGVIQVEVEDVPAPEPPAPKKLTRVK